MNVSILVVRAFLEVVANAGVSPERFFAAAGLDATRLDDMDASLDLSELRALEEAALALTGDPALGIHMGERASATAYDAIGHLATHASTLRDSIEMLVRYSRVLSDVRITFDERDDLATLTFRFTGRPDSPAVRLRAEMTVTGFVRLLRTYGGEDAVPHEVCFEHVAPPYRAEYTRLFGGIERFGQPATTIRFDRAMLARTTLHTSPRLRAILADEAERMLGRLDHGVTYAERLRELLGTREGGGAPTMTWVAGRLGMSVRSLRRRLSEEGVSFPKLVEEAQVTLAKRLLESPERSIYAVAFEMGFSDPSAFHRAFRRWTGMTPGQYRATLR